MSLHRLLLASASALLLAAPAFAQTATPSMTPISGNASAPVTRGEFSAAMREALIANPEILTEAIKVLREKQDAAAQEEAQSALDKHQDELFKSSSAPSIGAKDADVTIVEFFDYHCGYCKQVMPTLARLVKEDKKARVVFREFPILSQDSVLASRAAIAVHRVAPDKYFEYHQQLMKSSGQFDEKKLTDMATKLGVNAKKFKDAMESKDTTDQLDQNRALAEDLGIRGTPALVFKDKLVPGALPYSELQRLVDNQRHGIDDTPKTGKATAEPAPARP